jgi:transposase
VQLHPDLLGTGASATTSLQGGPDEQRAQELQLARFRLHLGRHRTSLKNRIHGTLITFGKPCPVSDLFGHAGRELLDRLQIPDPWRRNVDVSLQLMDDLELQIARFVAEGLTNKEVAARLFLRRRRSNTTLATCLRSSGSPLGRASLGSRSVARSHGRGRAATTPA